VSDLGPDPTPPTGSDLAVVGGGILGLAVARELLARHPDASLRLLERESELAAHQTSHSSGVIHAGIYYEPGSLKARLCVEGARDLYAYCDERGIEARRNGKLIVAADDSELPRLDELERRGLSNEVPGLIRVGPDEIAAIEAHATGVAALHSPATGVVDFAEVARAFAEDVRAAGGRIELGVEVTDVESVDAGFVVVCAGAGADRLAIAAGAPTEPRIVPVRGTYLQLKPERRDLVRTSIYPVPDPDLPFLGAHLTRSIDGEVLLGPSALLTGGYGRPETWRLAGRFWRYGAAELGRAASRRLYVRGLRRYVPELRATDTVRAFAGVRAQALGRDGRLVDDFVVHRTERALHVRNAPSPAATSSLALARLIADQAEGDPAFGSPVRTRS
jgi:(S)-2-hydroxyglutarate dehydrogenase